MLISFLFLISCFGFQGSLTAMHFLSNSVHHDTLILTDSVRSPSRHGFGINLSFDNSRSSHCISMDKQLSRCYNQLQNNPQLHEAFQYLKFQTRTDIERVVNVFDQLASNNSSGLKIVDSLLQLREAMPHDAALQKHFHTALEKLKPIISYPDGKLKETLTNSEISHIKNIANEFNKAAQTWYEDVGVLNMAYRALDGSVNVNSFAPAGNVSYYEISHLKSTKFNEIFKDVLRVNDLHALKVCKTFCKEELAGISPEVFVEKINSPEYAQDRALLAKFGNIKADTSESRMQLERYMRYAQQGCSKLEYAYACRIFSRALATERLSGESQVLSSMNDYSVPAPNAFQDVIRQKILAVYAQHVPGLQDPAQSQRIATLFAKMDAAYGNMLKGDWKSQILLEKALLPGFCEKAFDLDLNKIVAPEHSENKQLFSDCLGEIVGALNKMKEEGVLYTKIEYNPDAPTGFYMFKERKLDLREYFGKIEGHQLDHAIHRVTLKNFKVSAHLYSQGIAESRKELFEAANKSNEMVLGFVKMRDYGTAINLSVFAHRALEYIKSARHFFHANNGYYANMYRDAYIGMALGVAEGAKNVAQEAGTFVAHPFDASLEMITRLDHLCTSLQRCVEKICDVGDKLLINPREGIHDLMGYYQKLNEAAELLRDRIEKTSLSTACRHTTKFITETVLTGEVLKVVGLGCRAIKAESLALINEIKAERAAESIIATTAEGIEIRAAQTMENAVLKEAAVVPSSAGSREVVLPKVKTYEQARNQALKIIGEVDPLAGRPHKGNIGVGEGKIVGRRWYGHKVILRLDWDPKKGPHINVTDYRPGKSTAGNVFTIPFEGDLKTVESLLKHLNS